MSTSNGVNLVPSSIAHAKGHQEDLIVVLLDLRALDRVVDILDRQRMERKELLDPLRLLRGRVLDVEPEGMAG